MFNDSDIDSDIAYDVFGFRFKHPKLFTITNPLMQAANYTIGALCMGDPIRKGVLIALAGGPVTAFVSSLAIQGIVRPWSQSVDEDDDAYLALIILNFLLIHAAVFGTMPLGASIMSLIAPSEAEVSMRELCENQAIGFGLMCLARLLLAMFPVLINMLMDRYCYGDEDAPSPVVSGAAPRTPDFQVHTIIERILNFQVYTTIERILTVDVLEEIAEAVVGPASVTRAAVALGSPDPRLRDPLLPVAEPSAAPPGTAMAAPVPVMRAQGSVQYLQSLIAQPILLTKPAAGTGTR